MKIVVDANLFASGLIKPKSNPGNILDLIKKNQLELILSPDIIKEIKRILLYPKIQKYHLKTPREIDAYFEDILIFAWIVEGKEPVDIIKNDPTDNKYLACAYEGEADYIVSGDHHLLDIKTYKGIEIIKPKAFLNIWRTRGETQSLSCIEKGILIQKKWDTHPCRLQAHVSFKHSSA